MPIPASAMTQVLLQRLRTHARLWLPLLAALAGTLWAPPAPAAMASTAVAAQTPAWWAAYDDPQLRELLARSAARPGPLLRGYVELSVAALRAGIAARLHELASDRLDALQRGADGDAAARAALQTAAQRARQYALLQQATEAEAEQRLAALAALGGLDEHRLRQQMAEAMAVPQVPSPLPEPEPPPLRRDDPAALQREWARQALLEAAAQAQRSQALLQAARMERDAAQLRQGAGVAGVEALADAETQWLVQAARLAADAGTLALAWSQWLQAGGALEPRTAQAQRR